MRKFFKIFFIFLFSLILFGLSKNVQANSISKISMDIYIDNNGDATVTEIWNCNTSQGTEVYHPYYNLGNSEITNLRVSENGNYYQTLSSWNTSGTLSSKANKCGINKISNGVELCWGISSYGSHTYTAQYNISNFVSELSDSQMAYWTLIPYDFSNSIENVYIKIHTDFDIPDTVGVWGYGYYGGTAYVCDGYIEMQSNGGLSSDEYMTILIQFPSRTFDTNNTLNHDFNYYFEMAEEGSVKYVGNNDEYSKFEFLIVSFIVIFIIACIAVITQSDSETSKLHFGSAGKHISKDIPYYRDIPCGNDIFRAYYIGYQYGLLKNKTDILGSIILKWTKDSVIRIEQKNSNGIFKKEDTVIILNETNPETCLVNEHEKKLFRMLYDASVDGILENKEFEEWCEKSYSRILMWFDTILNEQKLKLINDGLIISEEKKFLKFFKYTDITATYELKQEAIELAGLKKFLREYTRIKDREAIEVIMFEDYLIYAQMLGIAKQVAKDFKELYPEIIEKSNFNSYDNIMFITFCATRGIGQAQNAKSAAEIRASGGRGGGSFGGGGGGGGFR